MPIVAYDSEALSSKEELVTSLSRLNTLIRPLNGREPNNCHHHRERRQAHVDWW